MLPRLESQLVTAAGKVLAHGGTCNSPVVNALFKLRLRLFGLAPHFVEHDLRHEQGFRFLSLWDRSSDTIIMKAETVTLAPWKPLIFFMT